MYKKRHSFLFRRPRQLGVGKVKDIKQMTPEEVDAELKVVIGDLQELGVIPSLKPDLRSKEQVGRIDAESRVHTVKKVHHFISKVKKHG